MIRPGNAAHVGRRALVNVLAALVAALLSLIASPGLAAAAPVLPAQSYAYDGHHHTAHNARASTGRGPPATYEHSTHCDCIVLRPHADVARSVALPPTDSTYDGPAPFVQGVDTAVNTSDVMSSIQRSAALATRGSVAAETGPQFFRGARGADPPSFAPRTNEFKVDPETGLVRETHGVSVFDNPGSVSSKGFTPHEIDQSTIPSELRIIQRGQDPHHYEIVPKPGANLTPEQFGACLSRIRCY